MSALASRLAQRSRSGPRVHHARTLYTRGRRRSPTTEPACVVLTSARIDKATRPEFLGLTQEARNWPAVEDSLKCLRRRCSEQTDFKTSTGRSQGHGYNQSVGLCSDDEGSRKNCVKSKSGYRDRARAMVLIHNRGTALISRSHMEGRRCPAPAIPTPPARRG